MKTARRTKARKARPKRGDRDGTEKELLRLLAAVESKALTDGDPHAAKLIVELASRLCSGVNQIACAHQALADEIARERTNWPINCDGHPEILRNNLRWLTVLPLGERAGWAKPNPRKPYSLNTVANATVFATVQSIVTGRAITHKDMGKPIVFEMVWDVIMSRGTPESYERLRPLGKPFADKQTDTCPEGGRSYESNVRDGIRQRLRTAFRTQMKSKVSQRIGATKFGKLT